MKNIILSCAFALSASLFSSARTVTTLHDGWMFSRGDADSITALSPVRVPHDWAIYGPFDRSIDLQEVAIKQNGETEKTWKTARTGGLPFIGKGVYRTTFEVADTASRSISLLFDGAMSNPVVYVNGREAGHWGSGYNSFYLDVTDLVAPGSNDLEVRLENKPSSSRWYPGAGLYRNVHVIETYRIHVPVWGTHLTTPHVSADMASVNLTTTIAGAPSRSRIKAVTVIRDMEGNVVTADSTVHEVHGQPLSQNFLIENPRLWSPDSPELYTATTTLSLDSAVVDTYTTRFGIRSIEYIPKKGFFLNGRPMKFRGVCNHHDLGPLGAAVNRSALRHQLMLLKDMGCNAIRTSHNMPAPELVELCDELGLMMMVEAFDDWSYRPKSENGYGSIFDQWYERDISNMVRHYRNNPSVVMWSNGNEVPSQWDRTNGVTTSQAMIDIIHDLDPTRPVTNGMDQIKAVLDNGFASTLDIPGFNYKPGHYQRAYEKLPQKLILGSETASTVSSRGVYKFPPEQKKMATYPDMQSSSYDVEACSWSNIPDIDFAADDDLPYMIGQFVWTGFDYLGEPTPYDTDSWPAHSSYFGIIDLASLPKDRFYLYRSKWNEADTTLHILPHWTWPGREGEVTPVFVYTNFPGAELFVNGESQGIRHKCDSTVMHRCRLMWDDVIYRPGTLRVVAYDAEGHPAAESSVATAGKPHHLVLTPHRDSVPASDDELVYITVTAEDRDGNPVPVADNLVKFSVEGGGTFEATANGDPKSLRPFHLPEMPLFSGAATLIVRSSTSPSDITIRATAKSLHPATLTLPKSH
ncbi:MAG: DUF4982 domain-containing protein [Lachnoclostridium sp.]|nr:DUF4982 domain-containing protein [Lachnoclostridium sp.]